MAEFLFRLPSDLTILASLRRDLATWLGQFDFISEQDLTDIILATHEAAANAIEHATDPFGPGQVTAWLADRVLTVEIRDSGAWADAPVSEERGRGLTVIRSLADDVRISKNPRGTTLRLIYRPGERFLA